MIPALGKKRRTVKLRLAWTTKEDLIKTKSKQTNLTVTGDQGDGSAC